MNQQLKRARELGRYAVQLAREEGFSTMARRGAGFFKRRFLGKKARYLPTKNYLAAQRAEYAGKTADSACLIAEFEKSSGLGLVGFFESWLSGTASVM